MIDESKILGTDEENYPPMPAAFGNQSFDTASCVDKATRVAVVTTVAFLHNVCLNFCSWITFLFESVFTVSTLSDSSS